MEVEGGCGGERGGDQGEGGEVEADAGGSGGDGGEDEGESWGS